MPGMFGSKPAPSSGGVGIGMDELEDDELDMGVDPMDDGMGEDAPSETFNIYAEQALGTADPSKISALRECIRVVLEEGGPMGPEALPELPALGEEEPL